MRFLSNIAVEHAIAHHLDHLTPEKVISHRPLKLTEALHLYLALMEHGLNPHTIAVPPTGTSVSLALTLA